MKLKQLGKPRKSFFFVYEGNDRDWKSGQSQDPSKTPSCFVFFVNTKIEFQNLVSDKLESTILHLLLILYSFILITHGPYGMAFDSGQDQIKILKYYDKHEF